MKNIDVNKFYKTMDQLMSDFSPPRVSTSFEKKVGASLCKASELAMSDKLPKFSSNTKACKFHQIVDL